MSAFYGLEIAKKALFVNQKAIEVTGHNIANANTEGYTRQRIVAQAVSPDSGPSRFANATKGLVGGGVTIKTVDQIRNEFLDKEFRKENSLKNEWATRADELSYVESLFTELSDTGISNSIADFLESIQEVTKNPENKEFRTNMLQNGLKMCETFNHYYNQLAEKQRDINESIRVVTIKINDIARSLSEINYQIARYELSGQQANDLRDSRNLLLDKLSELVDFTYSEDASGKLTVEVGGHTLVSHMSYNELTVTPSAYNPVTGQNDLYNITWADDGTALNANSGSMKAYLDLRDGNSAGDIGIPYIIKSLNELASSLATEFNAIHSQGYTMPHYSNGNTSVTGINFFKVPTDADGNPLPITAGNLSISDDIINNVYNIAASSVEITGDELKGNNENALKMVALFNETGVTGVGGFDSFLKALISEIAVETNHTYTMFESQSILTENLEYQKTSISGVSIDEELTSLIKYQQSYGAAARVINAVDEALEILINKTGLVGR